MKQGNLFDVGDPIAAPQALVRPARYPVWTENKASLIDIYLRLFVYITRHGVYIDGFAGPQQPDKPDTWAARLVLASEPRWFRKFFLFELDEAKIAMLRELAQTQPPRKKGEPKRTIEIFPGDMNVNIQELLASKKISMKEATFCLLDQWTNQCDWATVEALARYKTGNKIELFYFLANGWMDRSLAAIRNPDRPRKWWGKDDWEKLRGIKSIDRVQLFVDRFKDELGYKHVLPWPIYERRHGRNVMFYMIHATDHPEAPSLMDRAYHRAVGGEKGFEQVPMKFT